MTQLLVILFRFLLAILFVRLIVRAVAALFGRPARKGATAPRPKGELVRDRVCNTFLPPERAIRAVVAGREEHFCSPACRDRALAAVSCAS